MANRTFNTTLLGFVKRRVEVLGVVQVGAAGAVTLLKRRFLNGAISFIQAPTTGTGYAVGNGEGIRSVARTGTGAWTITLSDAYLCIFGVSLVGNSNSTGVPTIATVGLLGNTTDVTTNGGTGSGGTVYVQMVDFAGSAADPASGDVLALSITLADGGEP